MNDPSQESGQQDVGDPRGGSYFRPAPPRVGRVAAGFYAVCFAGAVAWTLLAGRPWWQIFWDPERANPARALLGLTIGALIGGLIVLLSRWTVARFGWGRELYRWFASLLGPVSWRQALWLATLSSVGEEALFRGAMQPSLGITWTSVIFGLMHLPPKGSMLPWTASAFVLGVAFGELTWWSGTTLGAILAHFVINLFNLRHVAAFCEAAPESHSGSQSNQR